MPFRCPAPFSSAFNWVSSLRVPCKSACEQVSKGEFTIDMTFSGWTKPIVYLALLTLCTCARGQSSGLQLYSDEKELRRALTDLPPADPTTVVGTTPEKAYLIQATGTVFNRPESLTAIFCDRTTAFSSIEDGVTGVLKSAGYDVSPGWDAWGTLKATKVTDASSEAKEPPDIFKLPPRREDMTLRVKVDRKGLSNHALTLDYTVLAGPRPDHMTDMSTDPAVGRYMDGLFGRMRRAAEEALKAHCRRIKVTNIKSKEEAVQKLVETLHLSATQEKDVRAAVGEE